MPTPRVTTCADCKYCAQPNGFHICKRYPPTPVHTGSVPTGDYLHLYPVIDPSDQSCGEYANKPGE